MQRGREERRAEGMPIAMGPLPSTSGRDRTSEFHAIVDRLRKTQGSTLPYANGTNGSLGNGHAAAAASSETARLLPSGNNALQSEFTKRASQIGLSIHQTSQKLSKLAKCEFRVFFVFFEHSWFSGARVCAVLVIVIECAFFCGVFWVGCSGEADVDV